MSKLKNKNRKKLLVSIGIGVCALLGTTTFFLLSNEKPTYTQNNTPPINKPEEVIEKKVQVIDENSNSRPYAVMINNISTVWKYQSGLNDAYLVYEMLAEGGITRELALFKDSKIEKIQSVRSARHYYLDYVLENDAIYVHWGWSPQAQSDIKTLKINNINGLYYEGTYFFRDSTIKGIGSEHKGYTSMEKLIKASEKLGYRTTSDTMLLKYDAESINLTSYETVTDANYVEIPYSGSYTAKFYYDPDTKLYKKSQNKTEMIDYTSKERVTAKNIIVYNVGYKTIDDYGRQTMDNIGSGEGYFISEGKAVKITWSKDSRSSKTIYKLENGEELVVNDGTTYIGLQPKTRSIKLSKELP